MKNSDLATNSVTVKDSMMDFENYLVTNSVTGMDSEMDFEKQTDSVMEIEMVTGKD